MTAPKDLQLRIWQILQVARPGDRLSRAFDIGILTLIFFNVLAVVLGTVEAIQVWVGGFLDAFEVFSVGMFTIEYALRLWSCVADRRFPHAVLGRLRFALTAMALIDLAAVLPFYLGALEVDLRIVRAMRLLRILRIAKLGRYMAALRLCARVLQAKKEELVLTSAVMALLLLLAGSLMFFAEKDAQPDAFPNIPASLWWAVMTLTTVGYGDVYPITPLGRGIGAVVAVLGIGLFALPTGILGAGFVEEIQRERQAQRCPHCGKPLE